MKKKEKMTIEASEVGEMPPMSAAESVKSITRRCRGPQDPNPTPALTVLINRRGLGEKSATAFKDLQESNYATTGQMIGALIEAGYREEASMLDAATRKGCGYDVNELILSQPLDGQEHEAPCPRCGRVTRWTAPMEVTT